MTRSIGGSLLPSTPSQYQLRPLKGLQVRPLPDRDTHGLFHGDDEIASHPNGYSCLELAARMVAGDALRALEQAGFIVDCGGHVSFHRVNGWMRNNTP